jgi:hypothetical protein
MYVLHLDQYDVPQATHSAVMIVRTASSHI